MPGQLLYDADCGFCARCAGWLRCRGRDLQVVPMQAVDLVAYGVIPSRAQREVPFRHDDGRVTFGAAAIGDALLACRQPWPIVGELLRLRGVDLLADLIYRLVAAHRHRLPGGTPACAVST